MRCEHITDAPARTLHTGHNMTHRHSRDGDGAYAIIHAQFSHGTIAKAYHERGSASGDIGILPGI